jgi:hypothetical protein
MRSEGVYQLSNHSSAQDANAPLYRLHRKFQYMAPQETNAFMACVPSKPRFEMNSHPFCLQLVLTAVGGLLCAFMEQTAAGVRLTAKMS